MDRSGESNPNGFESAGPTGSEPGGVRFRGSSDAPTSNVASYSAIQDKNATDGPSTLRYLQQSWSNAFSGVFGAYLVPSLVQNCKFELECTKD